MKQRRLKAISLFASAGIGETYFKDIGIDVIVANELLKSRADLYKAINPTTDVVCGDITDENVFDRIINLCPSKIDFLLASPPCQGMSVAGKNRCQTTMEKDKRNYLITYVVKAIKLTKPDYVLIENVPALLKLKLNYDGEYRTVLEILNYEFQDKYIIESGVVDSSDYGVAQTRLRAIIKMYNPQKTWRMAKKQEKVTVEQAIGNLPSLEAGQKSNLKWHFARKHTAENILWMKHTPTGKTAFSNDIYYPQKKDGTRIKGYESSYRRIRWDAPAPTITIRNDCIASQRNVHPGRLLPDGTYSDARVLTPLELMIINSLPKDWNIPDDTPELLIRQCIGESIPPLMLKEIARGIYDEEN